jgi:AcrR family transcriptional regulator
MFKMEEQPLAAALTDRVAEKRRRILDAARLLMLREGLRGTTMEAIARAAGIAKPTLYAQFADKEAVFTGILDELTEALVTGFDNGMNGPGGVARRIGAAMAGKYGAIAQVIENSPFAEELYATHSRVSTHFRALDTRMNEDIVAALKGAGVAEPSELNRLIQAACYGVARKLIDEASVRTLIPILCDRLITPELPRG